jgi:acetyltransferase-like isoleucine patch superfamily enzyme
VIIIPNIIGRLLHKLAFVLPGGYSLRPWLHKKRGSKIGNGVWISQLVYIDELYPEAVTIGENSTIGLRTSIFTHFHWGERRVGGYGEVVIGKDVFIGPHCLILPNVHIGDGSVIKGGTVVTKDVPPYTFFGAPPAEVLGKVMVPLTPDHDYKEFIRGLRPVRNGKRPK